MSKPRINFRIRSPSPLPPPPPKAAPRLLTHSYNANPTPGALHPPLHVVPTADFLQDSSHPFHLRTVRRIRAFDPTRFHFRIHCPLDVSRKAIIRTWATRRVQRAVTARLAAMGWTRDGSWIGPAPGEIPRAKGWERGKSGPEKLAGSQLGGSLYVMLNREGPVSLQASDAEVGEAVQSMLTSVLTRCAQGAPSKRKKVFP